MEAESGIVLLGVLSMCPDARDTIYKCCIEGLF